MARGKARARHVPMRTCVGCRQVRAKREMMRVVRAPDGSVHVDPTGKRSGRGAYLCPREECLEAARKGHQLERALECTMDGGLWEMLAQELSSLTGQKAGSH